MGNAKLKVVLNDYLYKDRKAFAAIGIGGGCVTRDFIIDENERFQGNYAFFNVLADYWKIQQKYDGMRFYAGRTTSFVVFEEKSAEMFNKISDRLEMLLRYEYKQGVFEEAKERAKNSFSGYYKDAAFRARYKSFEFLDLNKHFLLSELNKDVENIEFNDFVACAEKLIVPSNMCIYLIGDIAGVKKTDYEMLSEMVGNRNHTVQLKNFSYDPYLRQDAHIVELARQDVNQSVVTFDFLNPDCSEFVKTLIIDIYAEKLKIQDAEIVIDSCDAGILYTGEKPYSVKNELTGISKEEYEKARKAIVKKYIIWLQDQPEIFVREAANKLLQGIYIQEYISYIEKCSYEKFMELCYLANYKISEAKVIFRKEIK